MPPQLRAGVSRAVTTPPVGIAHPFWGAQTHTRAEGVDLDLWTTALVVSDGTTTAAIVDSDLPNVPDSLRPRSAARLRADRHPADPHPGLRHPHPLRRRARARLVPGRRRDDPRLRRDADRQDRRGGLGGAARACGRPGSRAGSATPRSA